MRIIYIWVSALFILTSCKLETKSSAELLFPLGVHTWNKSEDFRNSPPGDTCVGCPEFKLSSPSLANLENQGWRVKLAPGETSMEVSGFIEGYADLPEC